MQNTNATGIAVLVSKKNAQTLMGRYSASDRLMYVDVMCDGVVARCISVYTPHVGYPSKDFDNVYQQMRSLLGDSVRGGLKIFIGAQLGVGFRGDFLAELCYSFDPHNANHEGRPNAKIFCSSLGVKKRFGLHHPHFGFCPPGFFCRSPEIPLAHGSRS